MIFNCTLRAVTKTILSLLTIVLLLTTAHHVCLAQGFLRADGQKIVNEKGENILLRGIGLGGWMLQEGYMLKKNEGGQQHVIRKSLEDLVGPEKTAQFYELWLSNHTRKIDIDSMKAWGFNSVRLPMHYNLYTLPVEKEPVPGQNTWLEKGFQMTDNLLNWCKANKMYLILDLHAAPGGQGTDMNISDRDPSKPSLWDSEANQEKMIALWKKLAQRYANEEWIAAYDIINEPNWGFEDYSKDPNGLQEKKNEPLKKLMVRITQAIREVDQKHIIVIEGNGWGNNYNNMLPPWDSNMVLSYHKYWNYNDDNAIAHIVKSRSDYNIPVWLGETGENSNVWFTQCVALLERNNIGWAWWPLKKIGFNNPLEVRSNPEYEQIVKYWNEKGPKPDAATAWQGLQQVAENLKFENNIVHRDVIDALLRQPHTDAVVPFRKHVIKKTASIPAVDYDLGKNGKAYYDLDSANYWVSQGPRGGNQGHVYRNDGADISKDSDGAYVIDNFEKGEWLQYTVEVLKKGKYALTLSVASEEASTIKVTVNGNTITDAMPVGSGSTPEWTKLATSTAILNQGKNIINVSVTSGKIKLKSIEFQPAK
jgi:endoglucanase